MRSIQVFLRSRACVVKGGIGLFWEVVWIYLGFCLNLEELDI